MSMYDVVMACWERHENASTEHGAEYAKREAVELAPLATLHELHRIADAMEKLAEAQAFRALEGTLPSATAGTPYNPFMPD